MNYRSVDDAIRDGWSITFGPGGHWWTAVGEHRYHVTAKRGDYHVELSGNSLAELRRAIRMLRGVPRDDIPYGRDWWAQR